MRESEAGVCASCLYYRAETNDPDMLYKFCEIHRDIGVLKTLQNCIEVEELDMKGFAICDPTVTLCGKYAPDFASMWLAKIVNKRRAKKEARLAARAAKRGMGAKELPCEDLEGEQA